MSKVKAPAILLNKDFFSLIENKKWLKEQGDEALKVLLSFWLESSKEPECKVRREDVALLDLHLKDISDERILEILDSAVKVKLLNFKSGFYFNSQIVEDQDSYKTKAKNYSEGRKKAEQKKTESSENPARIQTESSEDLARTPIISSLSSISLNTNKKEYEINLPCIKLEKGTWDALVLNYYHGNKAAACAMCEAASDYLQSKGESVPADCMAYLRGWMRKGVRFDAAKAKPEKKSNHEKNLELSARLRAMEGNQDA